MVYRDPKWGRIYNLNAEAIRAAGCSGWAGRWGAASRLYTQGVLPEAPALLHGWPPDGAQFG